MSQSSLTTAPAGTDYPGKTLGIVGLILAILVSLVGFVVSLVALNQSKKAGYKNTPALAGVVVGAILLVVTVISWTITAIAAASMY